MLPALWLTLAASALVPDSNIAMFHGGPTHTGVYPATAGSYGGVAWRTETGGPVRSSPVVTGGVVYVGSNDGHLYALDAARGAVRWRYDAGSPVSSTPAVAGNTIVFSATDGSVQAVSLAGRRLWRTPTGRDAKLPWGYESGDVWTSSPVIVGQSVLVGSGDGGLYRLSLASGKVEWRAATGGRVRSSPAVARNLAVVGSYDGQLYAFDVASGKERWRFATKGIDFKSDTFGYDRKSIQSSPAIAGDLVLAGARDGFLYAVDLDSGKQRWVMDHKVSWVNCSVAVSDGLVFTGTSDGAFLQAIDLATGTQRWRADTLGVIWSSPVVSGDKVYTVTTRGPVIAFDKESGRELWRVRYGAGSFSSPTISGNRMYLGTEDGGIYAIDLSAPKPLRRMVFWDEKLDKVTLLPDGDRLRDYLTARGYDLLTAGNAVEALNPAYARGSVVVFAQDYLMPEIEGTDASSSLLRRYLEAGGRVVWPGIPPGMWPRDTASDRLRIRAIDRGGPERLLGVSHQGANFDQRGVSWITAAGRRYGLGGWFNAAWSADTTGVSEVLARDDQGHAAAWTKRFGTAGGLFVRMPIPAVGEGAMPVFGVIQRVAEMTAR